MDSGSSQHYTGQSSDLKHFKRWKNPRKIKIANGTTVDAEGEGIMRLEGVGFKNTWLVPSFKNTRLISVKALDQQGHTVSFRKGIATITKDGKEVFTATLNGALYIMDGQENANKVEEVKRQFANKLVLTETLTELWHRRMAHVNYRDLQRLESVGEGMKLDGQLKRSPGHHDCEGCAAGKMKESFNKTTDSRSTAPLGRIHWHTAISPASKTNHSMATAITYLL